MADKWDAARVGDPYHCKVHKAEGNVESTKITGSPNVEINDLRAARVTDRAHCDGSKQRDRILKGSATVEINGLPAARTDDTTKHGGKISEGSGNVEIGGARVRATAAQIAAQILANPRIKLATRHQSGHADDKATAADNLKDLKDGKNANRSSYEDVVAGKKVPGKGDSTGVDVDALEGLNDVGKDHDITVSEVAGGVHNPGSKHYDGEAFDISEIDGKTVTQRGADTTVTSVRQALSDDGANFILGPGDPDHGDHIHAQYPPRGP